MSHQPLSMTGCITPKFLETLVTTTPATVVFVSDRVLLIIVLVVFLSRVKLSCWHYLRNNRLLERLVLLQCLLRLYCQTPLFLIVIKDSTSILVPRITELPVLGGWIDVTPENFQEPLIAHFCWIIYNLNGLSVASSACRDLFVSRILF